MNDQNFARPKGRVVFDDPLRRPQHGGFAPIRPEGEHTPATQSKPPRDYIVTEDGTKIYRDGSSSR